MPRRESLLGCGHYGCVFGTAYSNVVFKITTDINEAMLTAYLTNLKHQPEGIVKYLSIYELPVTHRKRPVYILWREEAFNVGKTPDNYMISDNMKRTYDGQIAREFTNRMFSFQAAAGEARRILRNAKDQTKTLKDSSRYDAWARENYSSDEYATNNIFSLDRDNGKLVERTLRIFNGPRRLSLALNICRFQAEMIANTEFGYEVGKALETLLEDGILLADVHMGNIGSVHREDNFGLVVITDPGHAVDLAGNLTVKPPMLSGF